MSSGVRRSSHLSRLLESLRLLRGLKPGQLAARLCASNISKVGNMIRAFELGEPMSDHWLQKLINELHPIKPTCSTAWNWIWPRPQIS